MDDPFERVDVSIITLLFAMIFKFYPTQDSPGPTPCARATFIRCCKRPSALTHSRRKISRGANCFKQIVDQSGFFRESGY